MSGGSAWVGRGADFIPPATDGWHGLWQGFARIWTRLRLRLRLPSAEALPIREGHLCAIQAREDSTTQGGNYKMNYEMTLLEPNDYELCRLLPIPLVTSSHHPKTQYESID